MPPIIDPVEQLTSDLHRLCVSAQQAIERQRAQVGYAVTLKQKSAQVSSVVTSNLAQLRLRPGTAASAPPPAPATATEALREAEQQLDEATRAADEVTRRYSAVRRVRDKWYQFW
jgi:hypothetical protein